MYMVRFGCMYGHYYKSCCLQATLGLMLIYYVIQPMMMVDTSEMFEFYWLRLSYIGQALLGFTLMFSLVTQLTLFLQDKRKSRDQLDYLLNWI